MDYQKAYFSLFNAVTDAIKSLQIVQIETEELFIKEDDTKTYGK